MDWKTLFLTASGRIGQRDFWIGFVILFAVSIVLGMIPVLGQIISVVLIYPMVCIYSKRLHDMGKSGWLAAVPYAILAVAGIIGMLTGGMAMIGAASNDPAAAMAGLGGAMGLLGLGALLCLAFLLWVGLSKGDPAPNQYGPPPTPLSTAV